MLIPNNLGPAVFIFRFNPWPSFLIIRVDQKFNQFIEKSMPKSLFASLVLKTVSRKNDTFCL